MRLSPPPITEAANVQLQAHYYERVNSVLKPPPKLIVTISLNSITDILEEDIKACSLSHFGLWQSVESHGRAVNGERPVEEVRRDEKSSVTQQTF